jgi:hypothetical protein
MVVAVVTWRFTYRPSEDRVRYGHKGWFRLWLVIALVWCVGGVILLIIPFLVPAQFHAYTSSSRDPALGGGQVFNWVYFCGWVTLAFLPPIVLYIIGRVVYWIYKGFKVDKEEEIAED